MHRLDASENPNKKREFLLSRALMRYVLSQKFNIPVSEWLFIDKPNSPPIIQNLPEPVYFSLSHSNGLICFVMTDSPIGLDVEATYKKRDFIALADVFMTNKEIKNLKACDETEVAHYFYRIWCAKEAYFKSDSKIELNTLFKKTSIISFIKKSKHWSLVEGNIDDFSLSIIVKSKALSLEKNYLTILDNTFFIAGGY